MVLGNFFRSLGRKFRSIFKMNGVHKDAPIGVQCIQIFANKCCPRLQVNRLRCYQASILVLTYLAYLSFHMARKPLSVVKSVLHRNCSGLTPPPSVPNPNDPYWCNWAPFNTHEANALLGAMDSAFLFSYAAAMFVSGMIAERVNIRYFLSLGLLVSAIFCYLMGLAYTLGIHSISYYIIVQACAGIAQTTGWPGVVAVVARWFDGKKGLIFGIWSSQTSLGNIIGSIMAAEYVESNWGLSFIYPSALMGAVAFIVFLFLTPAPAAVGLELSGRDSLSSQPRKLDDEDGEPSQVIVGEQAASLRPHRHSANTMHEADLSETTSLLNRRSSTTTSSGVAVPFSRAIRIPGVIEFSMSLFFAKLVSYTFLFWLPMYITTSTNLTPKQAGKLSTVFDAGGALGAILAGYLADCSLCPGLVCVGFYTLAAPTLFVYQTYGPVSYTINVILLTMTGALVNGPYALITTAVSAELGQHSSLAGDHEALATVTAIIDGTGSVGAAVGPLIAGVVSSTGSWSAVFYMLIACNVTALLFLIRIVKKEVMKLLQERRLNSPRVVRIE